MWLDKAEQVNKNSHQHNKAQLKTTLLLYYITGFGCLNESSGIYL
jgi:hypothetical protein